MRYYIRTYIPPKYLKYYLQRYIDMYSIKIDDIKINDYLTKNFKTNLKQVFNYLKLYCNLSTFKPNIVEIYCNSNVYLGNTKLTNIVNFLEYGNLDIQSPKIISKLFKNVINGIKNALRGY